MEVLTSKGSFIIREATKKDLESLVDIHVISWNATYPEYEPKPSRNLRLSQWKKHFAEKQDNWFCYVAEKNNSEIAGFATGHDFNEKELPFDGQLNKIHFLKEYQRIGLGRALVSKIVETFILKGFNSMILFADPGNVNIRFYEVLNGEKILDKDGEFKGAFGWKNLTALYDLCKKESST